MYGRAFESTFTGSMVGSGANVFSVWFYVCSHMRAKDYTVELNPVILAALIGKITAEDATAAIDFLCRPDANSRSKEEDGRRLVKEGAFLYRVVNGEKYKKMRDEDERRDYMRTYMREVRAEEKAKVNNANKSQQLIDVNKCEPLLAQAVSSKHKAEAVPTGGLISDQEKTLSKKTKKEKKLTESEQKNGYNPVAMWIRAIGYFCKIPSPKVTGFEVKYLTELGNLYPQDEFRAMLKAYGEDHEANGKAWKLFDEFYKSHAFWRSKGRVASRSIDPGSEEALQLILAGKEVPNASDYA